MTASAALVVGQMDNAFATKVTGVTWSLASPAQGRRSRPDLSWLPLLYDVVCLGTPHLGTPADRGAAAVAWPLGTFPETALCGALIDRRSAGIKDLAHGTLYTTAPHARQHFLAATVATDPTGVPGRLVDDLPCRWPTPPTRFRRRSTPCSAA